ncbi:hypothetical protein FSP39_024632 [Pinctada imbricata]|uniref:oleoyl-[acyl-carrier-protein] hydrolase n=1 Tax=Pinctada imbricata TaxID=66713 RepID=A0AA89C2J6_PINIB|nr:hypothetical protein FSP39_024632 [Pinctada imbricata]
MSSGSVKFDVSVMKATGEFEICESGALVASGVVHTPTEPLRTFYDETDNIQTPISPNRLSQIPLSMSDVYKEFRLRGYEYGPTFQGIMKAGNQGERAELEWTGQWISFLDTMLQVNLLTLPGRGLLLPVGVRQLTINPLAHINKILPLEGGKKGVVVLVDRYAAITVSGGVEMQGLEVKNAPAKVSGSAPVVEKSVFIPYIDQSIGSSELVDYAQCCSSLITELVRKLSTIKGIQNQQIFKDFLKKEKSSKSQVDQKKISSLSYSGLLSFAKRLTSSASSKNFLDIYSNMIAAYKTELLKDCLLTSYLHQESLKPCIDVVIENTDTNVLRVLEVEATESKLQKEVLKYLEHQPSVHVEFTAADSQVTNQNPGLQELEEQGVEVRRWNLSEDPENAEAYDLIVANNVLHNQSNITKCLQNMSKALKNNGFLLFVEATRNHVIGLIFEGLANKIPEMEDMESRTLSCYCDEKQWEKLLESTGYKVVAMKTDNCFNTTFLARKSQDIAISKQTVLSVNGSHAEWLNKLKDKMLKMQEAPKGHNLWLVSDQREASGIVGLTNCLRKEPGGERIRCICNMESNKEKLRQTDLDKVMRKDLVMNVFTGKKWGSYRHLQIDEPGKVECEDAYLTCKVPGDSSSLTWVPNQSNHSSHKEEGKLPVKVFYTALNIEDKALIEMTATETLRLEHPGQEFSGIDDKGRQVMGLLAEGKALSPLIIADVHRLWEVPHHWNLREASTVSWCYSMAYYALILQGQVKKNTRVLIHGGDSDIGVASINVAMHAGCKVLATVESWDRKSYLLDCCSKLKKKFIYVNEKGHVYHDMLRTTKEEGVDVVLNTYLDRPAGPEFDLLTAKGGKYLDMCRYNKNNVLEGDRLTSNTELYHINMDHLTPAIEEKLYTLVRDGIVKGEVQPIKSKIYQKNKVKEALRDIGPNMKGYSKVVIQLRDEHDVNKNDPVSIERIKIPVTPEVTCHPDKVYILTGGLGGFGLELSDWLVQKGAKKLVLTSRSGITQGYQAKKRRLWNAEGVQVEIMTNNIKVETECKRLLENSMKMGPIGGIFNLAMVLKDGMLDSQSVESFSTVLEPKVMGTLNLDKLSRSLCKDSLDWFVVFSSVTSGRGNIGQTNYGYANSFMERVCERRQEESLPGLAIQWGAIGDVGVVIDKMGGNDTVVGGTIPQRMASCLVTMEQLLLQTQPVVSSFVPASKETRRSTGEEGEKKSMLEAVLHVIGIKDVDSLSPESTLGDLGMDSLMSVEIKMILDSQYKLTLTDTEVRKLTVKKMQEFSKKKESKKSERGSPKQETVAVNNTVSDGDASMLLLPRERIIRLNKGQENKDPIFLIHSLDASVQHWEPYMKRLDNPVYGIQAVPTVPTKYVDAVAGLYHQLIDSVAPDKKINLVGHSFGGIVALEMMLQSQIEKGRSGTLVMIDSSLDFLPDLSHDINPCDEITGQMDIIILKEFVNRLKLDSSLLNLNETASLDEKMSSVTRFVLESGKFTNAAHIQHAARKFHDRVVAYLEYATDDGVRGEIHLIRPENCPEKRCQETKNYNLDSFANKVTVHTIDSNHADVVNGTAMGSIVEHLKNIFSTDGN